MITITEWVRLGVPFWKSSYPRDPFRKSDCSPRLQSRAGCDGENSSSRSGRRVSVRLVPGCAWALN